MHFLQNVSVRSKLLAIVLFSCSGLILITVASLSDYKHSLIEAKKEELKHLVESSVGVIQMIRDKQTSGELTKEQAQALAISVVEHQRFDGTNYFWINGMDYKMIMNPVAPEMNGTDLRGVKDTTGKVIINEFVKTVQEHGSGYVEYQWVRPGSGTPSPKISYVTAVPGWQWIVGTGIYVDDVDMQFNSMAQRYILILLLTMGLVAGTAYLISKHLLKSIGQLRQTIDQVAKHGQLDVRANLEQSDELGDMGADFDQMLDKLQEFVASVERAAQELSENSGDMSKSANKVQQAMDSQRCDADQVVNAMVEMSASSNEVAKSLEGTSEATKEADSMSSAAYEIFSSATESMKHLAQYVGESSEIIKNVEEDALSISRVLDVIRAIAEQTNLLALNAAIEAARAGEQGRGFAVVADEVRTLAQRTQNSTQEIQSMIEKLQHSSKQAVDSMSQSFGLVQKSDENASAASDSLSGVNDAIAKIRNMNVSIAAASSQQLRVSEEINRNMVNIAKSSGATLESARHTAGEAQKLSQLSDCLHQKTKLIYRS